AGTRDSQSRQRVFHDPEGIAEESQGQRAATRMVALRHSAPGQHTSIHAPTLKGSRRYSTPSGLVSSSLCFAGALHPSAQTARRGPRIAPAFPMNPLRGFLMSAPCPNRLPFLLTAGYQVIDTCSTLIHTSLP